MKEPRMGRTKMVMKDASERAGQVRVGRGSVRATAALRLGLWRMRPAWRLLLTVQVGMIAAMMVVCAIPLFSQVALYTAIQGALNRDGSTHELHVDFATQTPSSQVLHRAEAQVAEYVQTYLTGTDVRVRETPDVLIQTTFVVQFTLPSATTKDTQAPAPTGSAVTQPGSAAPLSAAVPHSPLSGGSSGGIHLFGYSHEQQVQRLRLLEGRLPRPSDDGLEILITAPTASRLQLQPGSSLTLNVAPGASAPPLVLHVVGTFASTTPNSHPSFDPLKLPGMDDADIEYSAVADSDAIMSAAYPWASLALGSTGQGTAQIPPWSVSMTYQLDVSRLTAEHASALLQTARASYSNGISSWSSAGHDIPGVGENFMINTELFGALRDFQGGIRNAQIVVGVLLLAIMGLMLLFVTQMGSLLIARQEALIALLRSRGASRRQLFIVFAIQSLLLAGLSLLLGPLLAVPLVRQIALILLPIQRATTVAFALGGSPLALALGLWPVALATTLGLVLTLLVVINRAAALNILTLRQEAARSHHTPLWRKLYLDVLAALLALAGYGVLALGNSTASDMPAGQSENALPILSVLGLIAPLFLMVAITLLFLRGFPLLLRLGEWLAAHSRGAPAQLAFAHLTRAARQSSQVILLLALASGFALMTLSALATTDRYATKAAAFDAGADFSGVPTMPSADYTKLAGVQSAAKGHITAGSFIAPGQPQDSSAPAGMVVSAVESERYATTVAWPAANGTGSVATLLGLLRQKASSASAANTADAIPAIVDGSAGARVHASVGTIITLWMPEVNAKPVRFRIVAVVPHIPQMYINQPISGGNMLVDYARYTQAIAAAAGATSVTLPAPNYVWLHTASDSASLRSVRAALTSGPYQLTEIHTYLMNIELNLTIHDWRTELQEMHSNALYVDLTGTLALGGATALLLALLGTVVTLWAAMHERQVSFALLRALGSGSRRIVQQVVWEHGVVCAVGLLLGGLLGGLLTVAMAPTLPTLIFVRGFGGRIDVGGLPVRIAWPVQALGLTVGMLAAICAGAIVLAARAAAWPPLAAVLRLNED